MHSSKARDSPSHDGKSAKGPEKRGKSKKLHGTVTIKERIKIVI